MTKRFGFTLAEVLITLGIIGVVAAMTMPTLMNSTQGAQYKAAYKKALSALGQAVTLNVALDDSSFADTDAGTAGSADAAGTNKDIPTIGSILNARMNVVKVTKGDGVGYTITDASLPSATKLSQAGTNTTLFFNDGITFTFVAGDKGCSSGLAGTADNICKGYIDVNGAKGPNKVVSCSNANATAENCVAENPTDVYPVKFYNQTVLPNSPAARAVLYGK